MEGTVLPERTKTEKQNRNTVVSQQRQTGSNAKIIFTKECTLY
jgi:hypothetical protein